MLRYCNTTVSLRAHQFRIRLTVTRLTDTAAMSSWVHWTGPPEGPGDPPLRRTKGHGVQLLRQQAHRPEPGTSSWTEPARIPGHRLGGQFPVDGDQLAGATAGETRGARQKDASPNGLPAG